MTGSFLVYGIVYGAIGVCAVALPRLHGMTTSFGFVLIVGEIDRLGLGVPERADGGEVEPAP